MKLYGAVLALVILAFGCVGLFGDGGQQGGNANAAQSWESFTIPQSKISFTANYAVSEGSAEILKKVWRDKDRMRIDMSVPGSNGTLSIYFIGSKAYSCTRTRETACFEITESLTQNEVNGFYPDMKLDGAVEAESVEIGNTLGSCYYVPFEKFSSRKLCFTDRGVLAYEEYSNPDGTAHIEYLTDLVYAVNETDFVLPAGYAR